MFNLRLVIKFRTPRSPIELHTHTHIKADVLHIGFPMRTRHSIRMMQARVRPTAYSLKCKLIHLGSWGSCRLSEICMTSSAFKLIFSSSVYTYSYGRLTYYSTVTTAQDWCTQRILRNIFSLNPRQLKQHFATNHLDHLLISVMIT